jgi:hypothetical protein
MKPFYRRFEPYSRAGNIRSLQVVEKMNSPAHHGKWG